MQIKTVKTLNEIVKPFQKDVKKPSMKTVPSGVLVIACTYCRNKVHKDNY